MSEVLRPVRLRARWFCRAAVIAALLAGAAHGHAEVTRVEIGTRTPVAGYPYERLTGRVHFSLDPRNPRNAVVADIGAARTTSAGRVEFSAAFEVWAPTSGGSGVALLDIVNRGRRSGGFTGRTGDPDPYVGDGFLFRRGYTLVAVGWEFDVTPSADVLTIDAPVAYQAGEPVAGLVRGTVLADGAGTTLTVADLAGYQPVDADAADTSLTVRAEFWSTPREVPRSRWRLSGNVITMPSGVEPGGIYELAYRAKGPRVGGVGFAAVRDIGAWIKHDPEAPGHARRVIAFGSSQSGRFLRDFLYQGFNTDEAGRQVFDGVMPHIAGAARIDLNRRWSTPLTIAMYEATTFPFADAALPDPVTGDAEGLLSNPRVTANVPRVFYTNTDVEYWGGGRSAALMHTTPDGRGDLPLLPTTRIYYFAGAQHGPGPFPPAPGAITQELLNPVDYWWVMRALLVSMERWVRDEEPPPPSAHPRLEDRSLTPVEAVAFPPIPGVAAPHGLLAGVRDRNWLLNEGGGAGARLPLLVPQVDADGNSLAGIRVPEVAVPLATYTGWNFRSAAAGAPGRLAALVGSYVPFARTRADRAQAGDPRLSVEERYPARDVYLDRIREAAAALVARRFLLQEDVEAVVNRAAEHWELVTGGALRRGPEPARRVD